MKHFCIINSSTNIVELIVTLEGNFATPAEGFYEVEVPEHNPDYFGKQYINGEFV